MIIRGMSLRDIDQLKVIHEKYYSDEFDIQAFNQNFLRLFTVVDNDQIICAGGLRPLLESVIVTDKSVSTRRRFEALKLMLEYQRHSAKEMKISSIHAFIQDDKWLDHLLDYGFSPTKGKSILISSEG